MISIAEIARGTSFSGPVANVLGDAKVFLVVIYYSLEVAEVFISIAEIAIGTSFCGPVADFLGNAKVFLVVLYCSLEVPVPGNAKVFLLVVYCSSEVAEVLISIAEIAIGTSFSGPVDDVLGNAKVFLVVLYTIARWKSPIE